MSTNVVASTNEMTMRKYHEAVLALPGLPADIEAKAKAELAKLDATNAKRAATQSKKSKENEPIKQAIYNLLTAKGTMTSPDIATALNEQGITNTDGEPISTSKASSMCRQLAEEGRLSVSEVKVPKKGKLKAYTAIRSDEMGEDDPVQATDYELNTMF